MSSHWHSSNRARLFAAKNFATLIVGSDERRNNWQFAASLIDGNTDSQVIGFAGLLNRLNC